MKFTLAAGALGIACERYIAAREKAENEIWEQSVIAAMGPITADANYKVKQSGWWFWRKTFTIKIPQPDITRTREEAEACTKKWSMGYGKAPLWHAICKHKQASTLLEITDEEIGDIALHLIPSERTFDRI